MSTALSIATTATVMFGGLVILSWLIFGPLAIIERAAANWFREAIRIQVTQGVAAADEFTSRPPWYVRFVDKTYRR